MGKPTGFLDYSRQNNPAIPPEERIKNFNEFHPPINEEERRAQGARCMNCGVPFCQSAMTLGGMVSGCPLHNLIPEWNDEIYLNNWEQALHRLLKTDNFPEFTGRVCPALCEAACTCGMNDLPVTIRENEQAIIERGYLNGWVTPRPPKVRSGKQVAVVGSGPAGLAVADQLNHRGHLVTVYEKEDRIGGLLMYGIPNMKLEKQIVDRRVKLMQEEGVRFMTGTQIGKDLPAEELLKQYDAVVLCCGSGTPRDLPAEGRDAKNLYFAVDFLKNVTKSLLDPAEKEKGISAKGKRVVVVGGGDTGNDCVGTCIRQGAKSVTQLEMMPKPPEKRAANNPWPQWPRVLKTDYGQEEAIACFGKDPRVFETTVTKFLKDSKGALCGVETVCLQMETDKEGRRKMTPVPGSEQTLKADLLLIAAGFLGPDADTLKAFGVETNPRGNAVTKEGRYATPVEKVFAAGDTRRGQSLVVWAIAEGRAAAREVDEFLMGYTNMI